MRRLTTLLLPAVAAVALTGCFDAHEDGTVTVGETEGIYVNVDGLKYQVQISRPLNPDDPEDAVYLQGFEDPEDAVLDRGENWFAVFLRVENDSREVAAEAVETDEFEIEDTTGTKFEPVELDPSVNQFAYHADEVPPLGRIPEANTAAADSTTGGALLLFRIPGENLENRPLEFIIDGQSGEALVDLDV